MSGGQSPAVSAPAGCGENGTVPLQLGSDPADRDPSAPGGWRPRRSGSGAGARPLARVLELPLDGRRAAVLPLLELDPLAEELPDRAADREQRQRHERAWQAVDLPAGEEAEDDEQRMEPQRAPHHLRDDDVPLDLVDDEEQQRDPDRRRRVDDEGGEERRDAPQPTP